MTINNDLMKAILSMDAYNRGYDAGIEFHSPNETIGKQLGNYTITDHSSALLDTGGSPNIDDDISFYALAYEYNGETVISYRGTDNPLFDANTGYGIGAGLVDSTLPLLGTAQGDMALQFYNEVEDATTTPITTTGHSLGGGLAGYVGALKDVDAVVFDSMTFESAANDNCAQPAREKRLRKTSVAFNF